VDTNLRTPSKLSAGESMVLDRIGVHVRLGTGEGIPLEVRVVQPLGSMTYVTVGWDDDSLTARLLGMAHLPPGEPVDVSLDPAGLLFFDRESGRRIGSNGELV
jgi:ABC-type sugar transport system ATPase subunit